MRESILKEIDLNWSISKEKLMTETNKTTPLYGLYHKDRFITSVSKDYYVLQPSEMLDIVLSATKDLDFPSNTITGGHFNNELSYIQLCLPNYKVGGDHELEKRLTMTNSYNKSTAIGFGTTDTVIVCTNTFHKAYKAINKIKHYASNMESVKDVAANLNLLFIQYEQQIKMYEVMNGTSITKKDVFDTLEILTNISEESYNSPGILEKLSNKALGNYEQIGKSIKHEINEKGNTLFGLFNGVTYFYNNVSNSTSNVYSGIKFNKMNEAFDFLTKDLILS